MPSLIEPKKMKIPELRDELKKRGESTSGTKTELQLRLQRIIDEEEFGLQKEPTSTEAAEHFESTESVQEGGINETSDNIQEEVNASNNEETTFSAGIEESSPSVVEPHSNIIALTPEERKKAREARFGTVEPSISIPKKTVSVGLSTDDVLKKRAERFGLPISPEEEAEQKLKARAERFKSEVTPSASPEEDDKKRKRIEKFGVVVPEPSKKQHTTPNQNQHKTINHQNKFNKKNRGNKLGKK